MTYKTSLDRVAKVTTIAITILFAAIIVAQIFLINAEVKVAPISTTLIVLSVYFGIFSFRPINYTVTEHELIIHRPIADIKIKRSEIKSVESLDKAKLAWSWRIFGVGGLFGYWGKFTNTKLGTMTWYSTRRNEGVLITTTYNKKIVLTPDDTQGFAEAFNA